LAYARKCGCYYQKAMDLVSEDQTENSTSHYDVFTKTFGWEMRTLFRGRTNEDLAQSASTQTEWIVCRVRRKTFRSCAVPAAMRQLSIWSSRPSSLPRDSRTNKSAGVFCFAKRLIKRVPRRNRRNNGAGKKVNDRIDFIVFHGGKILCSLLETY